MASSRPCLIFSSPSVRGPPNEAQSRAGDAESNRRRHITLCTPGGRTRRVPLTITTLALDVIYRARPGETLLIAMYGLSTRVPEYGALLNAARRGVRLRILLDRKVGKKSAESLSQVLQREHLPIHVKSGHRMMHEKYVVNADTMLCADRYGQYEHRCSGTSLRASHNGVRE